LRDDAADSHCIGTIGGWILQDGRALPRERKPFASTQAGNFGTDDTIATAVITTAIAAAPATTTYAPFAAATGHSATAASATNAHAEAEQLLLGEKCQPVVDEAQDLMTALAAAAARTTSNADENVREYIMEIEI
jgi:hypothetical protein